MSTFEAALPLAAMSSLTTIAWISLSAAAACAVVIALDVAFGRRQPMAIMNVVWPLTALYAGPLALMAYFRLGRSDGPDTRSGHMHHSRPLWQAALLGTTHCGAGCMLGDVISDGGLFAMGASALLGSALLTAYVFDFIVAYLLGIVFQYFAIAPMRHLPLGEGVWAAMKADTLSLIAFQIGMYVWMAIYQLAIFHPPLRASSPVFWFMMQIGMLAGIATSYPMNWLLVRNGIKERM